MTVELVLWPGHVTLLAELEARVWWRPLHVLRLCVCPVWGVLAFGRFRDTSLKWPMLNDLTGDRYGCLSPSPRTDLTRALPVRLLPVLVGREQLQVSVVADLLTRVLR